MAELNKYVYLVKTKDVVLVLRSIKISGTPSKFVSYTKVKLRAQFGAVFLSKDLAKK